LGEAQTIFAGIHGTSPGRFDVSSWERELSKFIGVTTKSFAPKFSTLKYRIALGTSQKPFQERSCAMGKSNLRQKSALS
jgi:hypothetical protein